LFLNQEGREGGREGGRERGREGGRERERERERIDEANILSHLPKRMPMAKLQILFKTKLVLFSAAFEFAMILGFKNTTGAC